MSFSTTGPISGPSNIRNIAAELAKEKTVKVPKKAAYYNIPCAFDIETTSFISGRTEKQATMYAWVLGLNGHIIFGRTWNEFLYCLEVLSDVMNLSKDKRLVLYVHNLSFEFEFIGGLFEWENVFALREHKPVYALTSGGIEFRCSYILSRRSLEQLGKNLTKYPVRKLVGYLDYSKPRHSHTSLTDKEWEYIENDARVVMSYIQEKIESDGGIHKIPLTATGYVRKYCRHEALYGGGKRKTEEGKNIYFRYMDIMRNATIKPSEYSQLKRAFQGGFTHASAWKADKVLYNVTSFDFASSYPAVMVAERFPMSKAEEIAITSDEQFQEQLKTYCCLFDIEVFGLSDRLPWEHPLSMSRCRQVTGEVVDNGRLVKADHLITTVTEVDYGILKQFYHMESVKVGNFKRYRRGYLPTSFVHAILKLYKDKTELRGVPGKEKEYSLSKELLNSAYGMAVTDIVRPEIIYNSGGWSHTNPELYEALKQYNESRTRFLFYPWGVWVTAYARRNLFTGISSMGPDYVYSDTDSIKILNAENHMEYIEEYNRKAVNKLKIAMEHHELPFSMASPSTIYGESKPLGIWDPDGRYTMFKTLGAKRYLTYTEGKGLSMTVAGLGKKEGVAYLMATQDRNKFSVMARQKTSWDKDKLDKIFSMFSSDFEVPPGSSGKLTHTYIVGSMDGILIDYNGIPGEYHETGGVHLEGAGYSMKLSAEYAAFLRGLSDFYD